MGNEVAIELWIMNNNTTLKADKTLISYKMKNIFILIAIWIFAINLQGQTNYVGVGLRLTLHFEVYRIEYDNFDTGGPDIRFTPDVKIEGTSFQVACNENLDNVINPYTTIIPITSKIYEPRASIPDNVEFKLNIHEDDSGTSDCTFNGSDDDNCSIAYQILNIIDVYNGNTVSMTYDCSDDWEVRFRVRPVYQLVQCLDIIHVDINASGANDASAWTGQRPLW